MATNRAGASTHEIHALFQGGTFGGLTDRELLERFGRAGDAGSGRAFAALVERHGPMVLRTCRAVLADTDDAQDAFQVTFLVLARKAGSITNRDSVAAWLHGVAYRTAAYARGAAARRRRHERAAAVLSDTATGPVGPDDLAPALHEEVGRLPERLRAAVLLCDLQGLSLDDAARRLVCPVGTLKSRLFRARARLRRRLTARGFGPSGILAFPETGPAPALLVERTVAAASHVASGGSSGPVSAALAAWETGVLKAMMLSKLKPVAALLAFGLLAAGTTVVALSQTARKPGPTETTPAKAPKTLPTEQLLALLARSRIEAARQVRDDKWRLFQGGELAVTDYYQSEIRVLEAELAVCETRDDRVAVLRQLLKGTSAVEAATKKKFELDQATRADLKLAEFYRYDAALRLAEAESGRRASLRTAVKGGPTKPEDVQAVYDEFARNQASQEVESLLKKPITLDLPKGATLSDALKTLKAAGTGPFDNGTPIYVDEAGLVRAKVPIDSPVAVPKTTCTLGEAFTLVLRPLGLSYSLKDGLVRVSSR